MYFFPAKNRQVCSELIAWHGVGRPLLHCFYQRTRFQVFCQSHNAMA